MGAHTLTSFARDSRLVLDGFRRVVSALRLFDREAEKKVGLSGAQVFVLQKLSKRESISVNELAARTHTHQSSVSVVVARLVERGLVKREVSAQDGRKVELTLTRRGSMMRKRAPATAQDRMIAALRRMDPGGRRKLASQILRLTESMGIAGESVGLFFEEAGRRKKGLGNK
jgi:MarR family transcriptional regulator, lower aerobic nicotinate degradation pathway regulator